MALHISHKVNFWRNSLKHKTCSNVPLCSSMGHVAGCIEHSPILTSSCSICALTGLSVKIMFFSRKLRYVTFGLWHKPSSVVCNVVAPRPRLELFGNIFAPPNSAWTRTVCVKILDKNSKGFYGNVQVKYKGCKKLRFPTNILQDTAIVTKGDKQELVCDLSNGTIANDLQWPLT